MRERWSIVLRVVTGVAVFVAVAATWLEQSLFDSQTFARRAVVVLDVPAVRSELADIITTEVVANGPSTLASYRSLLQPAVEVILGTDGFKEVFRQAVVEVHDVVVQRHADRAVLDLGETLSMLAGSGAATGQSWAAQLPGDASSLLIDAAPVLRRAGIWRISERLSWLDEAAWSVTIAAAVGAVLISRRRRHAIAWLGAAVAIAGAALAALTRLAPRLVVADLSNAEVARAIEAAARAFLADLGLIGLWMVALGVLVAAATTAHEWPAPVTRARAGVERLARAVAAAPRWLQLLLGLAVVALAMLAVAQAEAFLLLAVLAVAGGAAYAGAVLAISALLGPAADPAAPGPRRHHAPHRVALTVGVGAVVLAVVGLGTVATVRRARATAAEPLQCNGSAELCDRRLDQVVLAGSHNSMAAQVDPGWLFAENTYGIPAQLESGIRALLVKSHYGVPTGVRIGGAEVVVTDTASEAANNRTEEVTELSAEAVAKATELEQTAPASRGTTGVYLCHVYCSLGSTPFVQSLHQVGQFLHRNPHEVVMIFIGDYVSPEDTQKVFEEAHLLDRVWKYDTSKPPPTLREMIEARKNLLVLGENQGGTLPWYTKGYGIFQDTPFTFTSPSQFSCAPNRGPTDASLFELNHFITPKGAPSIESARAVNDYDVLMGRARQCQAERKLLPNIVAVNFSDQGDLFRVVDALNGVPST